MGLGGRKRKADYPGCFDHGQRQSRPGRGRGGARGAVSNARLGGGGREPGWWRRGGVSNLDPTLGAAFCSPAENPHSPPAPSSAKWDNVERGAEGPARAELRSRRGRKEAAWNAGWTELRLDVLQSAGFESALGPFRPRLGPGLSYL